MVFGEFDSRRSLSHRLCDFGNGFGPIYGWAVMDCDDLVLCRSEVNAALRIAADAWSQKTLKKIRSGSFDFIEGIEDVKRHSDATILRMAKGAYLRRKRRYMQ